MPKTGNGALLRRLGIEVKECVDRYEIRTTDERRESGDQVKGPYRILGDPGIEQTSFQKSFRQDGPSRFPSGYSSMQCCRVNLHSISQQNDIANVEALEASWPKALTFSRANSKEDGARKK